MSNDKTKWIFDDDADDIADLGKTARPGEFTETLNDDQFMDTTHVGSSEPTISLGNDSAPVSDKTEIYTGASEDAGFAEDSDPVTGWLIVVKGPGLGQSIPLGAGMNSVGRGTGSRAALPFGDKLISSDDHIRIIYDDADRAFYASHGSGKNISRVNGQLLANTLPLEDDAVIELSKTTKVMFKQFCGKDFDWSDLDQSGSKAD